MYVLAFLTSEYKEVLNKVEVNVNRMSAEFMDAPQDAESYQYLQQLKRYVESFKAQNNF